MSTEKPSGFLARQCLVDIEDFNLKFLARLTMDHIENPMRSHEVRTSFEIVESHSESCSKSHSHLQSSFMVHSKNFIAVRSVT